MIRNFFLFLAIVFFTFSFVSCSNDDNPVEPQEQLSTLSSPYLICANRNPGGVGFDFEYNGTKGGANNLDSLTVNDFTYDLLIRTVQAEKPDGSLGGMPYITLANGVSAINYSNIDTTCKGLTAFQNLTSSTLKGFTYKTDAADFNISSLSTGSTGKPLLSEVQTEYSKLVIGQKWKTSANNTIDGDELIWIIKTTEGRIVKLIVTDFPASPAPTATGYIALGWDFLN